MELLDLRMTELLLELATSPLATAIRETEFVYPGLEIAHLSGMVLLIGPVIVLDLGILGVLSFNVGEAIAPFSRIAKLGFAIVLLSGVGLFLAQADRVATLPVFIAKMALVMVGAVNGFIIHRRSSRAKGTIGSNTNDRAGVSVTKLQAGLSIAVWFFVVVFAQLIAYM